MSVSSEAEILHWPRALCLGTGTHPPWGGGGYFLLGWQKVPGLESRAGAPQGAQVPKAAQIIPLGTCPHSRKGG